MALAEGTGLEVDQIRNDARQRRAVIAHQAVSYGILHGLSER